VRAQPFEEIAENQGVLLQEPVEGRETPPRYGRESRDGSSDASSSSPGPEWHWRQRHEYLYNLDREKALRIKREELKQKGGVWNTIERATGLYKIDVPTYREKYGKYWSQIPTLEEYNKRKALRDSKGHYYPI
ncbi:MAG TPA: hypothetical protein VFP68_03980, partial [Burkholderiaceae bacterium]|nr:hypothetical protein [Burkholderiaceae bacterium]